MQLKLNRLFVPAAVQQPASLPRGGSKWRNNYPEGSDHPVAPKRLDNKV